MKISDHIISFNPFLYKFISYDGFSYKVSFTCPKCGSHSCVKLTYDGSLNFDFWSGSFMCSSCGISCSEGHDFNYYHYCFSKVRISSDVQLLFDF